MKSQAQEKKEARYKKQTEASDKGNTQSIHRRNLQQLLGDWGALDPSARIATSLTLAISIVH